MNKSEQKENSSSLIISESSKRRKIDETMSENNISKCLDYSEETESNLSVTVYEDEQEYNYFNRSARKRLINTSFGKRSPLATINKTIKNNNNQQDSNQPSTSKGAVQKHNELNFKRLHSRDPSLIDPFSQLSDEILLHIFQYLPKKALHRIALVNTRFSRIMLDESLWIRMDLGNRAIKRGAMCRILSRGFIILRLAQAKIHAPIFNPHFNAEGFQSKLQYLDLSLASIDKVSLAQLLKTCRLLKKLSLEQVAVDFEVCKQIAENKNLEVLNLAMCEGLQLNCIVVLFKNLQAITALNISWTQLSNECVEGIVSLVSPALQRLNISGCRRTFLDSSLQTLIIRCPNIVELDLSDCTMLTATAITIVSSLKKLEYLSLSRCYNIPMTSYLSLNNIKSLLFLDVFGLLSDAGLQMLEKNIKNIGVNKFIHSSVARPTVMPRRTSIWGLRTRD